MNFGKDKTGWAAEMMQQLIEYYTSQMTQEWLYPTNNVKNILVKLPARDTMVSI